MQQLDSLARRIDADRNFTGTVDMLDFGAYGPDRTQVVQVSFHDGCLTSWHTHPAGQLLVCTAGQGLVVSTDGSSTELRPGVAVWTPAGENHWHGAVPGMDMTHLAIVGVAADGGTINWGAPVEGNAC